MAWACLKKEVEDAFSDLVDYVDPAELFAHSHFHIDNNIRSIRLTTMTREVMTKSQVAKKRSELEKKRKVYKAANARKQKLKKNIEKWRAEGTLVMVGRDLPVEKWREILLNPLTEAEHEAFKDFVFFLRHRKMHIDGIASLLQKDVETVRAALVARGVDLVR